MTGQAGMDGTVCMKREQVQRQVKLARTKGTHLSPGNRMVQQWMGTYSAGQCKWTHSFRDTHTQATDTAAVCLRHVNWQDRQTYRQRCARHKNAFAVRAPSQFVPKEGPTCPNIILSRGNEASAPRQ